MNTHQTPIRSILYANAIFCGATGLLLTLASQPAANFLGVGSHAFIILLLGIDLAAYAGLVFYFSSRAEISPNFVLFAIIADSLWVLGSVLLLATGWVPFSSAGKWAVGIVAMIVDLFATLQFLQWRKMLRSGSPVYNS